MPLEPHISRFSSRSTVNDVSALLTTPAPPFGELAAFCTVPIFVPKSYFQELFIFRNISISLGLQIHLLSLLPLISAYRGGGGGAGVLLAAPQYTRYIGLSPGRVVTGITLKKPFATPCYKIYLCLF